MADLAQIKRTSNLNGDSLPNAIAAPNPVADDDAPLPEPDDDEVGPAPSPSRAPSGWVWQGKLPAAFWKAATIFSFGVNLVLVIAVLGLALMMFQIKQAIAQPLLSGLHTSFVQMDAAHIVTT